MDILAKDERKHKRLVGDIASYLHRTFANDDVMYSQMSNKRKKYYRGIADNIIVKVILNTK